MANPESEPPAEHPSASAREASPEPFAASIKADEGARGAESLEPGENGGKLARRERPRAVSRTHYSFRRARNLAVRARRFAQAFRAVVLAGLSCAPGGSRLDAGAYVDGAQDADRAAPDAGDPCTCIDRCWTEYLSASSACGEANTMCVMACYETTPSYDRCIDDCDTRCGTLCKGFADPCCDPCTADCEETAYAELRGCLDSCLREHRSCERPLCEIAASCFLGCPESCLPGPCRP